MNYINIVVYNNLTLFNILHELKAKLNFKIGQLIKEKKDLNKYVNDNPKTLILTTENLTSEFNNIRIKKPIKIKTLIENINISFSKSKFKNQSKYNINKYHLDINSRFLIKDEIKLKLTEKEIDLILYLKNSDIEKNSLDLQKDIWKHSPDVETHTVETHIYRLRKKINEKFKDKDFILNNKKGYKLSN